ncbi:capsule assembly Wzi family protein [Cyclobacterium plantarum]|uniref:capsule assembly Wzi family protein n=1 Tax=Cyclobacterium plantarum TaxID=2716263 RepID=UPI003F702B5E
MIVNKHFALFFIFLSSYSFCMAQDLPVGFPVVEEALRRNQLQGDFDKGISFNIKPIKTGDLNIQDEIDGFQKEKPKKASVFRFVPVRNTLQYNHKRPYGWGNGLMIPNAGFQNYTSLGVFVNLKYLRIQFQPEYVVAQNLNYNGFSGQFEDKVNNLRYVYWNAGDFPERFGEGIYSVFGWGQSKVSGVYGAFELGVSTQNIGWGPGQFNALTIGNNATGFPHVTLNTIKPAKTFLGNVEMQLIIGTLKDSQLAPSQIPELNNRFFNEFSGDTKYLNAFSISYNPKWLPNLFVGVSRTYQQYNGMRGKEFRDYFPVLDPFQKSRVGFDQDLEGKDQQVTVSGRYVNRLARTEIYAEYGKRDHSYNWREFILNPDHARAFIFGFIKLFELPNFSRKLQIRGELTHQQESVNRYIRYSGLIGGLTWHTHFIARGFSNDGQALGVGAGVGSNVQTMEFSFVKKLNKLGILAERLANHQDFYYKAFGQQSERNPWVDLSLGLLFDQQWKNMLISSKLQFIHGKNYQWQLSEYSTPEFPSGQNKFSFFAKLDLIYFINIMN